ncbi:unnamed protein product [Notodromas monacha]|uniref:Uncharacterized protein n=1 Tax=Notodromas monacha TaxID=399045 RepID=A0A7R9BJH7_9CRUS|nr:unnamed protein product [Notodromas monacha]CAG0916643.1 unnamed protein product [Notodromas monacha]
MNSPKMLRDTPMTENQFISNVIDLRNRLKRPITARLPVRLTKKWFRLREFDGKSMLEFWDAWWSGKIAKQHLTMMPLAAGLLVGILDGQVAKIRIVEGEVVSMTREFQAVNKNIGNERNLDKPSGSRATKHQKNRKRKMARSVEENELDLEDVLVERSPITPETNSPSLWKVDHLIMVGAGIFLVFGLYYRNPPLQSIFDPNAIVNIEANHSSVGAGEDVSSPTIAHESQPHIYPQLVDTQELRKISLIDTSASCVLFHPQVNPLLENGEREQENKDVFLDIPAETNVRGGESPRVPMQKPPSLDALSRSTPNGLNRLVSKVQCDAAPKIHRGVPEMNLALIKQKTPSKGKFQKKRSHYESVSVIRFPLSYKKGMRIPVDRLFPQWQFRSSLPVLECQMENASPYTMTTFHIPRITLSPLLRSDQVSNASAARVKISRVNRSPREGALASPSMSCTSVKESKDVDCGKGIPQSTPLMIPGVIEDRTPMRRASSVSAVNVMTDHPIQLESHSAENVVVSILNHESFNVPLPDTRAIITGETPEGMNDMPNWQPVSSICSSQNFSRAEVVHFLFQLIGRYVNGECDFEQRGDQLMMRKK